MPMQLPVQIVSGENRFLLRDSVDQTFDVFLNRSCPIRLDALTAGWWIVQYRHVCFWTVMDFGSPLAVVVGDKQIDPSFLAPFVLKFRPGMTKLLCFDDFLPTEKSTVQMPGFSTDALLIDDPGCGHQVSVWIVLAVQMHIEIDPDTLRGKCLRELPRQFDLLVEIQLAWQRDDVIFSKLGGRATG